MATCITSPMFTYEDGPAYTLMEKAVTKAIAWRAGFANATGTPVTGGSMGNQLPIFLSQIKKAPATKKDGNVAMGASGVVFCGSSSHCSTHKGTFYQGEDFITTFPL